MLSRSRGRVLAVLPRVAAVSREYLRTAPRPPPPRPSHRHGGEMLVRSTLRALALARYATSTRRSAGTASAAGVKGERRVASAVVADGRTLEVTWNSGERSRFDAAWLRHNCHCPQCRQPGNGQKTVNFTALQQFDSLTADAEQFASDCASAADSGGKPILKIAWSKQGFGNQVVHAGSVPIDFLLEVEAERQGYKQRTPPFWTTKELPTLSYKDLPSADAPLPPPPPRSTHQSPAQSANAMWSLLEHLTTSGLCLVTGVPTVAGVVAKVASLIAPVQKTIYGQTFDVVAATDQQAINIAYTSEALSPHIDLAYYESPPGLQLLHCIRFDKVVEGGESTFIDGFFAAEKLRQISPVHYSNLLRIPATFQKVHYEREQPVEIVYQRPHITENHKKQICSITWAPAFEGPLLTDSEEDTRNYYEAYSAFAAIINDEQNLCQHRLQPGELVIFNNRRLLHGRNAIRLNGGQRFLQGCYVHIDEFRSKVNVFGRSHSRKHNHFRIFNNCFL